MAFQSDVKQVFVGFCSLHRGASCAKRAVMLGLLSLTALGMGCSTLSGLSRQLSYNDSFSEWVVGQRNSAFAAKAWHLRKHHFCNERYLDDFCAGFRAGYEDVASGGNGCTPAFPPQSYWSWKYQSAEGQTRVAAWFAGYPHGARAAEEDGLGNFSQLQMSSTIYNEYHAAGAPGTDAHLYPMPEPSNFQAPQPAGQPGVPAGPLEGTALPQPNSVTPIPMIDSNGLPLQ